MGGPGSVSPAGDLMRGANSTELNGHPFPHDLERVLGRPVRYANDANCLALSEATDGAGQGHRVVFAAILGTGCGAGITVDGRILIEVHDSGPGLSPDAAATLFEPTITFKKHGMGLGLSIARKHALVSGGDITLVPGELGGAGFRVVLPSA